MAGQERRLVAGRGELRGEADHRGRRDYPQHDHPPRVVHNGTSQPSKHGIQPFSRCSGMHRRGARSCVTYLSNGKLPAGRPSNNGVRSDPSVKDAWGPCYGGVPMSALSADAPPAEDTRARVLQVALELFAERGFAETSTRELSERLGFTKAALYYYFRTKDDLLAALIQPVLDQLTNLITQTPLRASPAARREVLAAYVDLGLAHVDLLRVLTQDPSVARRPVSAAHISLQERMLQLLAGHEGPDLTEQIRA